MVQPRSRGAEERRRQGRVHDRRRAQALPLAAGARRSRPRRVRRSSPRSRARRRGAEGRLLRPAGGGPGSRSERRSRRTYRPTRTRGSVSRSSTAAAAPNLPVKGMTRANERSAAPTAARAARHRPARTRANAASRPNGLRAIERPRSAPPPVSKPLSSRSRARTRRTRTNAFAWRFHCVAANGVKKSARTRTRAEPFATRAALAASAAAEAAAQIHAAPAGGTNVSGTRTTASSGG